MDEFIVKLRILVRAQVTLFKADAQRQKNQALLASISIGCVFVAIVFVNVGLFFVLTESDIDSHAAFILAGGNLALAIVPMLIRSRAKPGPEEEMIREIRDMAGDEVSKDIKEVADDFAAVGDGIKQLKSGVSAFTGGGGGAGGAMAILGPALPLVIDLLKKSRK